MHRKELHELAARLDSLAERLTAGCDRRAKTQIRVRLLKLLLQQLPQIPAFSLSDIAYLLHLEHTYCCKVFRELAGQRFSHWRRAIRIEKAQLLLRVREHTITEVAFAAGFSDITTLERNFRTELGVSPRMFRQLGVGAAEPELIAP